MGLRMPSIHLSLNPGTSHGRNSLSREAVVPLPGHLGHLLQGTEFLIISLRENPDILQGNPLAPACCPRSQYFVHYPKLLTIDEGRNVDWRVDLWVQLSFHHTRPVSCIQVLLLPVFSFCASSTSLNSEP